MSGLVLEAFAGAGGWSTGLALLGRNRSVGVELDRDACDTARAAGHLRVQADAAAFPLDHLTGRVDGVIASPPCQAWSRAGKRLGFRDQPRVFAHLDAVTRAGRWVPYDPGGWADPRSPLVLEPVRWVSVLRPRWVALEQVPDVAPFWSAVARWLRGVGYSAACGVLSAERFGVPQTRARAILVARCDGVPARLPEPTHHAYRADDNGPGLFGGGLLPWVSMADALGWPHDRPARTVAGQRSPRWAYGAGTTSYDTGWTLESSRPRPLGDPSMTVAFGHSDMRWALRNNTQDNAARRLLDQPAPTMFFGGRLNDVSWVTDRPATAVGGDPGHRDREGGQRQYDDQTVRVEVWQAGVLQSFPAGYPWSGTKTARFRQVGDAVPPLAAAAVLGELVGVDWRTLLWPEAVPA